MAIEEMYMSTAAKTWLSHLVGSERSCSIHKVIQIWILGVGGGGQGKREIEQENGKRTEKQR